MKAMFTTLAVAALALPLGIVHAQDYPTKPVRIIVPFTAGGLADVLARAVGDELGRKWNTPVYV